MGYKLIKYLESAEYNRKLFQLDSGEEDLPEIIPNGSVDPGSEAHSPKNGEKWFLDTKYNWIPIKETGGGGTGDYVNVLVIL